MFDEHIDSLLVKIAYYEGLRVEAQTLGLAGAATYDAIIDYCKQELASAERDLTQR